LKLCPSDSCPSYVRFGRRGEYRDDVVLCGECGAELVPVTSDEAEANVARTQPEPRLVARVFWGVVAVLALWAAFMAYQALRPSQVHFVNGLDRVVTIALGEGDDIEEILVAPGGRDVRTLAGRVRVRVSSGGESLADERVELPRGTDLVVYNVLGAADLCLTDHTYVPEDQVERSPFGILGPRVTSFRNRTLIVQDDVEFAFQPAPERIRVPGRNGANPELMVERRREFGYCQTDR